MLRLSFEKTDTGRCKILQSCYKELKHAEYSNLFTEDIICKLEDYTLNFEKIVSFYKSQKEEIEKFNLEYENLFTKAKIYFIHYYKSLLMAIERGELPTSAAESYNLKYPFLIPTPLNPEQLLYMSKVLFECDEKRIANGGRYLQNPTIGNVKIWFDKFLEIHQIKCNISNTKVAEVENIENIRLETDKFIEKILCDLKKHYSDLTINQQSEKLRELGFIPETEELKLIIEEVPEKVETRKKSKNTTVSPDQLSLFNFLNT